MFQLEHEETFKKKSCFLFKKFKNVKDHFDICVIALIPLKTLPEHRPVYPLNIPSDSMQRSCIKLMSCAWLSSGSLAASINPFTITIALRD